MRTAIVVLSAMLLYGCNQPQQRTYQGYVECDNIYLASPMSGKLKTALVKRGDRVTRGQMLFQLDGDPQQILVDEAYFFSVREKSTWADSKLPKRKEEIEAAAWTVKQVDEQISLAALRVKRYEELVAKHALDKDSLDAAKEHYEELLAARAAKQAALELTKTGARPLRTEALRAAWSEAKAKLAQAKWALSEKNITAPTDGVIFDIYYRTGEFVGTEKAIASLMAEENIYIQFFVPVDALASLQLGQHVQFTYDGDVRTHEATIQYISPEAEYIPPLVYSRENHDKLVFRINATTKESYLLKPGMPVLVTSAIHA